MIEKIKQVYENKLIPCSKMVDFTTSQLYTFNKCILDVQRNGKITYGFYQNPFEIKGEIKNNKELEIFFTLCDDLQKLYDWTTNRMCELARYTYRFIRKGDYRTLNIELLQMSFHDVNTHEKIDIKIDFFTGKITELKN